MSNDKLGTLTSKQRTTEINSCESRVEKYNNVKHFLKVLCHEVRHFSNDYSIHAGKHLDLNSLYGLQPLTAFGQCVKLWCKYFPALISFIATVVVAVVFGGTLFGNCSLSLKYMKACGKPRKCSLIYQQLLLWWFCHG